MTLMSSFFVRCVASHFVSHVNSIVPLLYLRQRRTNKASQYARSLVITEDSVIYVVRPFVGEFGGISFSIYDFFFLVTCLSTRDI